MSRLLLAALVTPVELGGEGHLLFSWRRRSGDVCAWLSPMPAGEPRASIHRDHAVLLRSFGGIVERSNEPSSWLLNHNDALTAREAEHDATFISDYGWAFEDVGGEIPIELDSYYSVAREANCNTTLCHRTSGDILLFAPDHAFTHVRPLAGCPEYTLYTVDGGAHFHEWVEAVAGQWWGAVSAA